MVAADYFNPATYTEKLQVPEGLTPSDPQTRGWFIPPSGLNIPIEPWIPFIAVLPAILVYILLFMETHISEYVYSINSAKYVLEEIAAVPFCFSGLVVFVRIV